MRQAAASSLHELAPGTKFKPVLDDPVVTEKSAIKRVVLCTGKLYYDLAKQRQALSSPASGHVAFIRLEELCPFPFAEVEEVLRGYAGAEEYVWLQEEPRNQGAYGHVAPRLCAVLQKLGRDRPLKYIGRNEDAVPAPGVARLYVEQQKAVLQAAFDRL